MFRRKKPLYFFLVDKINKYEPIKIDKHINKTKRKKFLLTTRAVMNKRKKLLASADLSRTPPASAKV